MRTDVAFVGTWRLERGPSPASIDRGISVAIWGDRWNRAPEWAKLAPSWRGSFLVDANYAKALQSSKVALGLLCKGNRDLHTRRSVEVPALGTVLCAERTTEHEQLFGDDGAVLWSDVSNCVEQCKELLADDERRLHAAERGRTRVIQLGLSNEPMSEAVLAVANGTRTAAEWPAALAS